MSNIEQTLSIIKPDAVERNLQDKIKQEFTNKGFEIIKEKKIHISKEEASSLDIWIFFSFIISNPLFVNSCLILS